MDPEWNEDRDALDGRAALSPAGVARREAMLRDLKTAVVRRRRRRTAFRRAAFASAGCILLAAVFLGRNGDDPRPPPGPDETARSGRPASPLVLANARLETIQDAPGILARVAVRDRPIPASAFTDDEGLLSSLAAAERPAGLVRFEGGVALAYHAAGVPEAGSAPR